MNQAGVLVGGWQSVAPFFFYFESFVSHSGLVCQDKTATDDCVVGQGAVCELNSSRCHPRVVSALLHVLAFPSGNLRPPRLLRSLSGQLLYIVPGQASF